MNVLPGERFRAIRNSSTLFGYTGTVILVDEVNTCFYIRWDQAPGKHDGIPWFEREINDMIERMTEKVSAGTRETHSIPHCSRCGNPSPYASGPFVCWSCKNYPFYNSTAEDD